MVYENAVGYLIGEENKGAGGDVHDDERGPVWSLGIQGLGMASAAYQAAVPSDHSERLQGRSLDGAKYPDKPADPNSGSSRHSADADDRQGPRSKGHGPWVCIREYKLELEQHHADESVLRKAGLLGGPDDTDHQGLVHRYRIGQSPTWACRSTGGAGYVTDTGVEQFVRDVRIHPESTRGTPNGVQALDLSAASWLPTTATP